jgi:nickel/cobalt exporter
MFPLRPTYRGLLHKPCALPYLVADEKALRKGLVLSFAAALVQACVAILIVGTVSVVLRATASTMNRLAMNVELLSFVIVALMGLVITWRKSGKVLGVMALARNPLGVLPEASCDHVHMPPPEELNRLTHWRDMAGVALAGVDRSRLLPGSRPFSAGIAATLAMSLGTALTTSAIAAVAVFR